MTDRRPIPPLRSASRRRKAGAAKIAFVAVVVVVTGVGLALAIPKFFGGHTDEAGMPPIHTDPAPVVPVPVPVHADPVADPTHGGTVVPTSDDGDLVLEVKLRWQRVDPGTTLPATVKIGNASKKAFQIPATGEPHPTLALVVLDAEGHEVRRVVESGVDPVPHRTVAVASGAIIELQALLLSSDDTPLPPGEYTVYAEFRKDPAWVRLGLPMWSAPKGSVRSLQEPLTVVAKE